MIKSIILSTIIVFIPLLAFPGNSLNLRVGINTRQRVELKDKEADTEEEKRKTEEDRFLKTAIAARTGKKALIRTVLL